MSLTSYEYVMSRMPFVVRRTVRWGDCDPAGIVYTGRFPEYVLGAVMLFTGHLAGGDMHRFSRELGMQMPCKAMSYEFMSALWPGDTFDIHCFVGAIRAHSFDIVCDARRENGTAVFKAVFSPICIDPTIRKRVAIPAPLLDKLTPHLDALRSRQ